MITNVIKGTSCEEVTTKCVYNYSIRVDLKLDKQEIFSTLSSKIRNLAEWIQLDIQFILFDQQKKHKIIWVIIFSHQKLQMEQWGHTDFRFAEFISRFKSVFLKFKRLKKNFALQYAILMV